MKLIIFTTCKPFLDDDAWRQEQAIKSWTLLEEIEKKIIIIGNDQGTKEICEKYNLIHEPNIKTLDGVPYLHEMFVIANKYAEANDVMLWTNSDMIYFSSIINVINLFKKNFENEKNYLLVGQRIDWYNPKKLENLSGESFFKNINFNKYIDINIRYQESNKFECAIHPPSGIDYVIHSPTTFENRIDKNLVIAGTRHDMIMLGCGIHNKFFTCDITKLNSVIHQNHGYSYKNSNILKQNNEKCWGTQKFISDCKYLMGVNNDKKIILIHLNI